MHFGLEGFIGPGLYICSIGVFVLSLFRPALALYVLVPLLPFQTIRYRLHPYPLGHSFIDLMLLASLTGSLLKRRLEFPKAFLRLALIATVIFTYVSLWTGAAFLSAPWPLWFDDLRLTTWKNSVLVPMALFVAVYGAIRTVGQAKILLGSMCVTTAMFNRNVYNNMGTQETSFSYQHRAETGGIGANGLAAFEVQFGFVLIALGLYETRWRLKLLYYSLAGFCFYCVMVSYSRGAYAALLIACLAVGLFKKRTVLILLAAFLCTWEAVVPNAVRERVLMTYTEGGELEQSAASRVTLWKDALEVINGDPVFGAGYDTYEFMHRDSVLNDTHNLYMKIAVECGVLGLALFLFLFWRLLRLGCGVWRSHADPFFAGLGFGLTLWMVCAAVTNMFGDRWNYIQISGYMWTMSAILVRAYIDSQRAEESGEEQGTDEQPVLVAEA